MAVQPTEQPRRSMLYRVLQEQGAEFEACGDAAVAMRYPESVGEADAVRTMAMADLTPLPRSGFKGRDTPEWLRQQGVDIPEAPNRARVQSDGGLVLRLSDDEHVVLSDLRLGSGLASVGARWRLEPGRLCYPMPRGDSHSWFALTGARAPEMLAKVCAVDMRPHRFENHRIAQTSIARTSGIVVRHNLGQVPCYYVLADSASAEFLWSCLLDAMQEFQGALVGLSVLQSRAG